MPDEADPGRHRVREIAHEPASSGSSGATYVSRNSAKRSSIAQVTAIADAQLRIAMLPPESSVPGVPSPNRFVRNAVPETSAASPTTT